jgi:hypothetical protein
MVLKHYKNTDLLKAAGLQLKELLHAIPGVAAVTTLFHKPQKILNSTDDNLSSETINSQKLFLIKLARNAKNHLKN